MDCGSGSSESSMRLIPFEKKYIAFDVSKYAVRKACNRFSNLKGVVGDIYKLPYKDESISGIYCCHSERILQGDDTRFVYCPFLALSV